MSPKRKPLPAECGTCGQWHERCTAHRRDGKPCSKHPIQGGTVCTTHGGRAPQVKDAAEKRVMEERARLAVAKFGLPRDITPADALIEEVQRSAGMVDFYTKAILEMDPDANPDVLYGGISQTKSKSVTVGDEESGVDVDAVEVESTWTSAPKTLVLMWMTERKHYADVAAAAARAGVELQAQGGITINVSWPESNPATQPAPIVVADPRGPAVES